MTLDETTNFAQAVSVGGTSALFALLGAIMLLLVLICYILWRTYQSSVKFRCDMSVNNERIWSQIKLGTENIKKLQETVSEHHTVITEHGMKLKEHEKRINILDKDAK